MADESKRLSRKWLYGPFVVAGLILLAYRMVWGYAADQMKVGLTDWVDVQRAAGYDITHDAITATGFPFFLRVHIDNVEAQSPTPWEWRTPRITLDALPYDLNKLIITIPKGHSVSEPIGRQWDIVADDWRAGLYRDPDTGWRYSMTIAEASAQSGGGELIDAGSIIFDIAPEAGGPETITLNLAASNLRFTGSEEPVTLETLQTSISLERADALVGVDPLALWRREGGAVAIHGLIALFEGSQLNASGRISVDKDNHLTGVLDSELRDPAGAARLFGKIGMLSNEEAELAAAGLALYAMAGRGRIAEQIEMRSGAAYLRGIKIADLPALD
ncbi:MAG: DUF2125 domain-containing protein [Pseudomonadota bacterium]